jgi:hypothetical protein
MADRHRQGPGLKDRDFRGMPDSGRLSFDLIPATTGSKESGMHADSQAIPSGLRSPGEAEGVGYHA